MKKLIVGTVGHIDHGKTTLTAAIQTLMSHEGCVLVVGADPIEHKTDFKEYLNLLDTSKKFENPKVWELEIPKPYKYSEKTKISISKHPMDKREIDIEEDSKQIKNSFGGVYKNTQKAFENRTNKRRKKKKNKKTHRK